MGQKVRPTGFRIGIMIDWLSQLVRQQAGLRRAAGRGPEDPQVRQEAVRRRRASPRSEIERTREKVVGLHLRGPGRHDHRQEGPGGRQADQGAGGPDATGTSRSRRWRSTGPRSTPQLVAEDIAEQLEKRPSFRRTMKRAIDQTMEAGAKGDPHAAVRPAGRLGNGPHAKAACRAASRCRRCGPRSTTASPRPRPPRATSASRCGSTTATILDSEEDDDAADAQAGKVSKKPARQGKR